MSIDIEAIRSQFPALALTDNGLRRIYFDNPGGTQVPQQVADAIADSLLTKNANLGAPFVTSRAADQTMQDGRDAMADFLNAPSSDEIIFGPSMTTLTFHLSRSIGQTLNPGDEILLSRMDHDGNVGPWLLMARDLNLEVRWLPFNTESYEIDERELDEVLTERTRLVCVGGASNLTGTINDVKKICAKARAVGALTYIDGVQSAPHIPIDVQDIGCDFFACSSYKFFGPHQGILWGRRDVLENLPPYKLRPVAPEIPYCFETGTPCIEGVAGITAAVDYIADIGEKMAQECQEQFAHFDGRKRDIHAAMSMLFDYEKTLASHLLDGLSAIDGVAIQGITAPDAMDRRLPTVSFTHERTAPAHIAAGLAKQNIFVWDGHFYAVEAAKSIGVYDSGGTLRVGPVHYNTAAEIDEMLEILPSLLK